MQRDQHVSVYGVLCRSFLFLLLGVLTSGTSEAQALSGSYTINSAVVTGGTNFQSFADAAIALNKGISSAVTFDVVAGSGPYTDDKVTFYKVTGASATNTITFNGNGATVTFQESDPGTAACFKLDGASHFIFDNIKIEALAVGAEANDKQTNAYCFQFLRNSDSNIVRKCTLTGFNTIRQATVGVLINGGDGWFDTAPSKCDYITITENNITNFYTGVEISSQDQIDYLGDYSIDSTKITFNTIRNTSYGMNMFGTNKTLIEGNDVGGMMTRTQSYGIWFDERNFGATITKNRFHDFAPDPTFPESSSLTVTGMFLAGSSYIGRETTISNNLLYNIDAPGGATGLSISDGGVKVAYMNIYNNTFSMDQATGTRTGTTVGVDYNSKAETFNFRNNIISIIRGGTGRNTLYDIGSNALPAVISFDRNDLYNGATEGSSNITGRYRGTSYATLVDFQKASTMEWHSINMNPAYVSLATGDLTPANTGIDNWGLPVPKVTTDINNAARSAATPDLGAYEFNTAACTSPPTAGAAVILPAVAVCTTTKMVLSLTGNSSGSAQTYEWESSDTETGTYTTVGAPSVTPLLDITSIVSKWYRCKVTCGGITTTSTPVQILTTGFFPAGTYTINAANATGGTNFKSFNDAVLAMKCGIAGPVIFNVVAGSGPYIEQVIIPQINNTSKTNTITFNGNKEIIRFLATVSSQRAVIKLDGADYVTINDLSIRPQGSASGEYGYGVQLLNDADNNTISNCSIDNFSATNTSSNFKGVVINSSHGSVTSSDATNLCDSNTVINNTIRYGNYCVILFSGQVDKLPTNNKFIGNTILDGNFAAIYIQKTVNTLIEGNDISRPNRTSSGNYSGVTFNTTSSGAKVSKNKFHNFMDKVTNTSSVFFAVNALDCHTPADAPIIVSNNLVYGVKGLSDQSAIQCLSSDNLQFFHNTIAMDDVTYTSTKLSRALYMTGGSTGIQFKNNNITVTRTGAGKRFAIYLNSPDEQLVSDYNNFYIKGPTATENSIGYSNGASATTLTAWTTATTNDAHSLILNPVYKDSANVDYTPTILALDNKGTPVNILKDFKDANRSTTTPDIGAFEFQICTPFTTAPEVVVDSAAMDLLRFKWTAVTGAVGYKVSRDGVTFTDPSSGVLGLTHTIGGLRASDTLGLLVKAINMAGCNDTTSKRVVGLTLSDMIYLPNTFTPNGDSHNDYFRIYGNNVVSVQMMIFNQWGERVFQTSSLTPGWDGSYKGKQQPVGVYVCVATVVLRDGSKVTKRGSINLVR